jgi:hypothetical protein
MGDLARFTGACKSLRELNTEFDVLRAAHNDAKEEGRLALLEYMAERSDVGLQLPDGNVLRCRATPSVRMPHEGTVAAKLETATIDREPPKLSGAKRKQREEVQEALTPRMAVAQCVLRHVKPCYYTHVQRLSLQPKAVRNLETLEPPQWVVDAAERWRGARTSLQQLTAEKAKRAQTYEATRDRLQNGVMGSVRQDFGGAQAIETVSAATREVENYVLRAKTCVQNSVRMRVCDLEAAVAAAVDQAIGNAEPESLEDAWGLWEAAMATEGAAQALEDTVRSEVARVLRERKCMHEVLTLDKAR